MRPIRRNEMSGMRTACDIVNRVAITWRGAYRTSLVFIRNRRMRLALRRRTYGGVAMRSKGAVESPPYPITDT